jgi:hypothetical protein
MTVDLVDRALDDDAAVLAYDWRLRDYQWIGPASPLAKASQSKITTMESSSGQ